MNAFKTFFLFTLMTVLLVAIGGYFGGQQGMVFAFGMAALMNFFAYWFSDKMALAMYGAKKVEEANIPQADKDRLLRITRELAQSARLPMPKVYVIPSPQPNAFATGRNPEHASVAATEGILRLLSDDELSGVMAHELAHVKNRDILIASVAATIAGAIMILSRSAMFFGGNRENRGGGNPIVMILLLILAPLAAMLVQMAISRQREFGADEGGARISHKPLALAEALKKLHNGVQRLPMQNANPATAHMFIVAPFSGKEVMKLFSTHPPVEERIARLYDLAKHM
ncbi:MAG TPA: zinc metalloprotease HtpX [candidate division Zixibacteria bacterium]|nr:zinc metalloprotease HtpX [candidate division Zixibacteria bacterium]